MMTVENMPLRGLGKGSAAGGSGNLIKSGVFSYNPPNLKRRFFMKVVLISGKAQHGKDTSAKYLEEILSKRGKKVLITHYGDVLKYICQKFFAWDGEKDEAGRTLLQTVGTETIRKMDQNYFVNFIQTILNFFPNTWDFVLIPDCRFPNEVETIPGVHLRIVRKNFESPLTAEQQKHMSEVALDNHPCDQLIVNDGTLFELYHKLEALAISMGWIENSHTCSGDPIDMKFCATNCLGEKCAL